jgi:hypothetical protein
MELKNGNVRRAHEVRAVKIMPDTQLVIRRLACTLALIASTGAAAQSWQQVVRGENSTAYADIGSIERSAPHATMRAMIDYQKPPFDGNNLPYRSLTMRNEYHCEEGRFRSLSITSHTGNMGSGEQPYTTDEPGDWEVVSPQTLQGNLWKVACLNSAPRSD